MEFLIETFDVVGKVLVSYTAIAVHYRVRKEHKIDKKVFSAMRKEQFVGVAGILLIVLSYFLSVSRFV